MTAAESNINTLDSDLNAANIGLKARMTAAETALDTKATSQSVTDLTTRVSTLEK